MYKNVFCSQNIEIVLVCKEIFHLVDPRTKQREQSFEFWNLKTCQLYQLEIQDLDEIDNVKC